MKILAIETSCDEISAAVVADGHRILNCEIESSRHEKTGGVVPELAARAASETILKVVENSLKNAKLTFDEIDAIAVTNGPGLAGPLLVGIETARALAFLHSKKLIATHHILGHIFANFLERENFHPKFPAVVLTVSGGHNDLILWRDFFDFEILGKTRDDAAGEAFDKFGKMIGENFPAGAAVAKLAARGDATKFKFPVPMKNSGDFDFSFSGLKTAARLKINELTAQLTARLKNKNKTAAKLEIEKLYNCRPGKNSQNFYPGSGNIFTEQKLKTDPGYFSSKNSGATEFQTKCDLAASFQNAVVESLTAKLFSAAEKFGAREIFLSGGVAANLNLRQKIADFCAAKNLRFTFPEIKFCTDNAAMIGAAAFFIFKLTRDLSRGLKSNQNFEWEKVRLNLDFDLPKFHRR